jgi:phage FluMu protein Com
VKGGGKNLDDQSATEREIRCECGNLLARIIEGGVELKCRRCKRTTIVPISSSDEFEEDSS